MSISSASRAIRLCGTETADPPRRMLRAGPLSAVFQDGMIRYVRLGDIEVLRAINFLVRTDNWGTLIPVIDELRFSETGDAFSVTYRAVCADDKRRLTYEARIQGSASGSLSFSATATPGTDVLTNRTGFTVLHPAALAGKAVSVEHVDGSREETMLPDLISPGQPIFLVRELAHEISPGVRARCRMGPDAFETEDQRNWSDASFKTYVRPKAMPAPYVVRKGETFSQSVELTIEGRFASTAAPARGPVRLSIGGDTGARMPLLGVGVSQTEADHALAAADLIKQMKPSLLICGIDLRTADTQRAVASYRKLGEATGAGIVLETIIPGGPDPAAELAPLAAAARAEGLTPESVAVFAAPDLLTYEAGADRPPVPSFEALARAARAAFPGTRIGGGMYATFTELNRKRPPPGVFDYVTHITGPTVHMADDGSVMEAIETMPHIFRSVRAFIGDTAYRIGPSSIGCRQNPDGGDPTPNPDDIRVCKGANDPRQRGLLAAAWALAYGASCAEGDLQAASLYNVTGPLGVIYRKLAFPQPPFDGNASARIYPAYHALAALAAGAGKPRLAVQTTNAAAVAATGWREGDRLVVWLANQTADRQAVDLGDRKPISAAVLDAAAFDRIVGSAAAADELDQAFAASGIDLDGYALARLTFAA